MPDSRWHNFKLVVKRVLRSPASVISLTLAVLFALFHQGWMGLVILGGVMVGVSIYAVLKLQDESFIRTTLREEHDRERRDDLMDRTFRIEELDVESRVRMKTIVKFQSEIAEDVSNLPVDGSDVGLEDTVRQTDELVERGLSLCRQRRDLLRYLTKTDDSTIINRVHSLESKLQDESDPERRSEVEASLAAKRQELDDYLAIEHSAARVLDQLDSIEIAFSSLRARLVRIKSTDVSEWLAANRELQTELSGLNTAADTLSQSINEALSTG
ncbi:MAG: hypothetical protein M1133_16765 [Armatimonadetes bacterium]|nr:hypothetical protein [Armatimonadota bacterium]